MTIIQEATQYLEAEESKMMEHQIPPKSYQIIAGLMTEIRCLKAQVCDRGNSYQKATEKIKALRDTLKEVSGCHEEHNTPKLCEGCLISIGNALAE